VRNEERSFIEFPEEPSIWDGVWELWHIYALERIRSWNCYSLVKYLPNMHMILYSNHGITKKSQ
jgi:hypothetical protein